MLSSPVCTQFQRVSCKVRTGYALEWFSPNHSSAGPSISGDRALVRRYLSRRTSLCGANSLDNSNLPTGSDIIVPTDSGLPYSRLVFQ